MKPETIDALLQVNERFYANQAQQFSNTRASSWKGWNRCVPFVARLLSCKSDSNAASGSVCVGEIWEASMGAVDSTCRVLDVACGNLRFEAFLSAALPGVSFEFAAVDNCELLVKDYARECADEGGSTISFQRMDVVAALRTHDERGSEASSFLGLRDGSYDVAVSFGFMHHVPTMRFRKRLLERLVASVRPGGCVAVSFWEFMNDASLAEKARLVHERALLDLGISGCDLDQNDFIIGWNNEPGAYRYCHSFTSAEIDGLLETMGDRVHVADRFFADGRTGDLNEYVVLQVV